MQEDAAIPALGPGQRTGREHVGELVRQLQRPVPADHHVLLPGPALRADPAVPDGDRAAERRGHRGIVGNRHHGGAEQSVRVPDQLDHRGRGGRVELGGRLVGEQQRGLIDQGQRQGQPLLLTAGQPPGPAVRGPGQADPVQQLAGPPAPGPGPAPRRGLGEQQIAERALVRQQVPRRVLQQQADLAHPEPGQRTAAEPGQPVAVDLHPAGGWPQQPGQVPEQGGLARPGRAEQGDHLPGPDGQVHPAQRRHFRARRAVDVHQVVAADRQLRPGAGGGRGVRGVAGRGHGSASRSRSGWTERTSSRLAMIAAAAPASSAPPSSRARAVADGR